MKVLALALVLTLSRGEVGSAAEPLRVSSFSTILTEIAEQVGGDRATVIAHVKKGVDPHEFEPKPGDLKIVSEAQLILLSAKHLEGYVSKLEEGTRTRGRIVQVGDTFPSLGSKADAHGHDHGHAHGEDPHWWHSIANAQRATRVVRDELAKVSPADAELFAANAAKHVQRLDALAKWAKVEVSKLPRNQRKLITTHDAFGYLAKDYGFTIHALTGVAGEEQPSSRRVAALIALIKAEKVKAIFAANFENPKVLNEIRRETGVKLGGTLYPDGLAEGAAETYEGMFRHNLSTIVEALR